MEIKAMIKQVMCVGLVWSGLAWRRAPRRSNGKADAYRHCEWSCSMTKSMGKEAAKKVGDNHEAWGGNDEGEQRMDLYNNQRGRDFGSSPATCSASCKSAAEEGTLQTSPEDN